MNNLIRPLSSEEIMFLTNLPYEQTINFNSLKRALMMDCEQIISLDSIKKIEYILYKITHTSLYKIHILNQSVDDIGDTEELIYEIIKIITNENDIFTLDDMEYLYDKIEALIINHFKA